MKSILVLITSLVLSVALAQTPSLSVSPQEMMNGAVSLDSVTLAEDGFVVVHAFDMNGELVLTPPLGLTYLAAGTYENVMIELDAALLEANGYGADEKNVLPMIHVDDGNQTYEFPEGPDVPVMVNDAMVVAELPVMMSMMDDQMSDGDMADSDMSDDDMTDGDMTGEGMMEDDMSDTMMDMLGEGTYELGLSGAQEVPAVMTEATGSATATLSGTTLTVSGDFSGLSSAYAASHVHMAAMGENGGVVFPLEATVSEDGTSGIFVGEAELDEAQLEAFMAGHLYVNIHSDMHGGGELRGQILSESMMGTPMLSVSDQMAANSVTIDSVTLAEDGFVVVHAYDRDGELVLTPPLGLTYLSAGTHEKVMIDLDTGLLADNGYSATRAKDVLPMIHVDDGDQTYEFPDGPDVPVMVDEEMVVATLALTLQ